MPYQIIPGTDRLPKGFIFGPPQHDYEPAPEGFTPDNADEWVKQDGVWVQDPAMAASLRDGDTTPPPSLHVSLDRTQIVANGTDTFTATVQVRRGDVVDTDAATMTHYVPILGIDGVQYDLLTVTVTNGEGSATWATDRSGIYTVDLDKTRPVPSIPLPEPVEVIATKV